jgi:ribosome-binding factor A
MQKRNPRHRRIEAQMQRALAVLLPRAVKDPRVGSVTVTEVVLAADMGLAKIYFLPFGTHPSAAEVTAGLLSATGFLRGEVARQLGLRHAPRLEFVLDTDLERAQSLSRLIDAAIAQDRRHGTESGLGSDDVD